MDMLMHEVAWASEDKPSPTYNKTAADDFENI